MARKIIQFQRRITREEADTSRILIRREFVRHFGGLPEELVVTLDGTRCTGTLLSAPCSCCGPARPHSHHFLLLRGGGRLDSGRRVTVRVEAIRPD
ncbi:MAG: hypothetical protein V2A76_15590 [Planctomycetota bacterium]